MLIEADLHGRNQQLALDEAVKRLRRSVGERARKLRETEGTQEEDFWTDMGYRSVAYDLSGLMIALQREYPDTWHAICEAHLRLWRSMMRNDFVPDTPELWFVLDELRAEK